MDSTIATEPPSIPTRLPISTDALSEAVYRLANRTPEQIAADRERGMKSVRRGRPLPPGKTLADVVEGAWPGEETDEQIYEALERSS